MSESLAKLARRLQDDPLFLSCPLALYCESAQMDDEKLAAMLGCCQDKLVLIRLCRAPDSSRFMEDIEQIVSRFELNEDALVMVVRAGQAILSMRQAASSIQGTLMAARDDEPGEAGRTEGAP